MYLSDRKNNVERDPHDHEELELLLESFSKQVEEIVNEAESIEVTLDVLLTHYVTNGSCFRVTFNRHRKLRSSFLTRTATLSLLSISRYTDSYVPSLLFWCDNRFLSLQWGLGPVPSWPVYLAWTWGIYLSAFGIALSIEHCSWPVIWRSIPMPSIWWQVHRLVSLY